MKFSAKPTGTGTPWIALMPLHVILSPRLGIHLDIGCWSSFHIYFLTHFLSKGSTEPTRHRGNISCCSISSRHVKAIGLQPLLIEVGWLAMLLFLVELSRHLLLCATCFAKQYSLQLQCARLTINNASRQNL